MTFSSPFVCRRSWRIGDGGRDRERERDIYLGSFRMRDELIHFYTTVCVFKPRERERGAQKSREFFFQVLRGLFLLIGNAQVMLSLILTVPLLLSTPTSITGSP
jgi:hypothetical protein